MPISDVAKIVSTCLLHLQDAGLVQKKWDYQKGTLNHRTFTAKPIHFVYLLLAVLPEACDTQPHAVLKQAARFLESESLLLLRDDGFHRATNLEQLAALAIGDQRTGTSHPYSDVGNICRLVSGTPVELAWEIRQLLTHTRAILKQRNKQCWIKKDLYI